MRYWKVKQFPGRPLVSVCAAAYTVEQRLRDAAMAFIYSVRAQTIEHWELHITHDGPASGLLAAVAALGDERITLVETATRLKQHGHPHRQAAMQQARGRYLCLNNCDNVLAPVYLESLLDPLVHGGADLSYCSLVHSHTLWQPMAVQLRRGKIDLACWMAKTELARAVPFDDYSFAGDWQYLAKLLKLTARAIEVPGYLLLHN